MSEVVGGKVVRRVVFADILKLTEMGWSAMISPYSEYHEIAFKVALSRRIKNNYSEAGRLTGTRGRSDLFLSER